MDIMERVNMLKDCDMINEEAYSDILSIINIFKEDFSIILDEDNAGVMITHMSMAFRRNETKEKIEPIGRDTYNQAVELEEYQKASEILDKIEQATKNELSNDEKEFFIVHICTLLLNV